MAVKLRIAEIKSIASEIYQNIKTEDNRHNREADAAKQTLIDSLLEENPVIKEIYEMEGSSNYTTSISERYLRKKYPQRFERLPEKKSTDYNMEERIRNSIVVKSIDAADVQELIRLVKLDFHTV